MLSRAPERKSMRHCLRCTRLGTHAAGRKGEADHSPFSSQRITPRVATNTRLVMPIGFMPLVSTSRRWRRVRLGLFLMRRTPVVCGWPTGWCVVSRMRSISIV